MPGLPWTQASLAEVLQVRGEPLQEHEIWAVLYQSIMALERISATVELQDWIHVALNVQPETLILCINGAVRFSFIRDAHFVKPFIAPEVLSGKSFSKEDYYAIVVYSLGMTLFAAAEYELPSNMDLLLSSELERLLCGMCDDSSSTRTLFQTVVECCSLHTEAHLAMASVACMAREIVGGEIEPPVIYDNQQMPLTMMPYGYLHLPSTLGQLMLECASSQGGTSEELVEERRFSPLSAVSSLTPLSRKRSPDGKHSMPGRITPDTSLRHGLAQPRHAHSSSNADPSASKCVNASEPWAPPPIASPDFHALLVLEKRKLEADGYLRDAHTNSYVHSDRVSPLKSMAWSKSLPVLHPADDARGNEEAQAKRLGSVEQDPPVLNDEPSRPRNGWSSRSVTSMTSRYSSAASLTHGAYSVQSDVTSFHDMFSVARTHDGNPDSQSSDDGWKGVQGVKKPFTVNPYLGPEFVRIPMDPENSVIDISQKQSSPLIKGGRHVQVVLPNLQKIETLILGSALCKELFNQVADHLGLRETMYFGLTQMKGGEHLYLDLDSKLSKYAPGSWRSKRKKFDPDFMLYFRVKFFVEDPLMLQHNLTRHLFYLQLRQDILAGSTECSDRICIQLASYALQAEYGRYHSGFDGLEYFQLEHYLPAQMIRRVSRADMLANLPRLHQLHAALSDAAAEAAFLDEAKNLPEYGVLFYRAGKDKKLDDQIYLGISVVGLLIFELRGHQKVLKHRQPWSKTRQFLFKKKKFIVEPRQPAVMPITTFYTDHYRKSKFLLQMCQSFHRFQLVKQARLEELRLSRTRSTVPDRAGESASTQIRMKPRKTFPEANSPLPMDRNSSESRKNEALSTKELPNREMAIDVPSDIESESRRSHDAAARAASSSQECVDASLEETKEPSDFVTGSSLSMDTFAALRRASSVENLNEMSDESDKELSDGMVVTSNRAPFAGRRPGARGNTLVLNRGESPRSSFDESSEKEESVFSSTSSTGVRPQLLSPPQRLPVARGNSVESSFASARDGQPVHSPDLQYDVPIEHVTLESLSRDSVFDMTNEEEACHSPEADHALVEEVTVFKTAGSLGISIMGGTESSLPQGGIYVKSIHTGGPAANVTSIHPWDRILSVNGVSLESVTHKEAVGVLRSADGLVKLVIGKRSLQEHVAVGSPGKADAAPPPEASGSSFLDKAVTEDGHVFSVDVLRTDEDIGLKLAEGKGSPKEYEGQIMIREIKPGKTFAKVGEFQVGDILLLVNDHVMEGMTVGEALAFLRDAPDRLKVVVKRLPRENLPDDLKTLPMIYDGSVNFVTALPSSLPKHTSTPEPVSDVMSEPGAGGSVKQSPRAADLQKLTRTQTQGAATKLVDGATILADSDGARQRLSDNTTVLTGSDDVLSTSEDDSSFCGRLRHRPPRPSSKTDPSSSISGHLKVTSPDRRPQSNPSSPEKKKGAPRELIFLPKEELLKMEVVLGASGGMMLVEAVGSDRSMFSVGDKILEIDGQPVEGQLMNCRMDDLVKRSPGPSMKFLIERSETYRKTSRDSNGMLSPTTSTGSFSSAPASPLLKRLNVLGQLSPKRTPESQRRNGSPGLVSGSQGDVVLVELFKGPSGLGISLGSGRSGSGCDFLFVKKISAGSAAEKNGGIHVGDQILSVNGRNMTGACQKDLVNLLRDLTGCVSFKLLRAPSCSSLNLSPATNMSLSRPSSGHFSGDLSTERSGNLSLPERPASVGGPNTSLTVPKPSSPSANQNERNSWELKYVRPLVAEERARFSPVSTAETSFTTGVDRDVAVSTSERRTRKDQSTRHDVELKMPLPPVTASYPDRSSLTSDVRSDADGSLALDGTSDDSSSPFRGAKRVRSIPYGMSKSGSLSTDEHASGSSRRSLYSSDLSNVSSDKNADDSLLGDANRTGCASATYMSDAVISKSSQGCSRNEAGSSVTESSHDEFHMSESSDHTCRSASQAGSGSTRKRGHSFVSLPDEVGWNSDEDVTFNDTLELPGIDPGRVIASRLSNTDSVLKLPTPGTVVNCRGASDKEISVPKMFVNSRGASETEKFVPEMVVEGLGASGMNMPIPEAVVDSRGASEKETASPEAVVDCRGASRKESSPPHPFLSASKSGIPIPIRSRSASLSSDGRSPRSASSAGIEAGRSTSIATVNAPTLPVVGTPKPEYLLDKKDFVFYAGASLENFMAVLDTKVENINAEFMNVRQIKIAESFDAARRASNRVKNRYKTIIPYDRNRVVLPGGEESDYINASHVKLSVGGRSLHFIAAQAPLRETCDDFWRCVWENKVELIVMLTKEYEGGKEKCYPYWPRTTTATLKILDRFEIRLIHEEEQEFFICRQLQLQNMKMRKSLFITQAAFKTWPDVGIPQESMEFLRFVKFIRNLHAGDDGMLVHCSAGVGRTGIFMAIHCAWSTIEQDFPLDMTKLLFVLCDQRQGMIQTKDQYKFCYRLVKDLLEELATGSGGDTKLLE